MVPTSIIVIVISSCFLQSVLADSHGTRDSKIIEEIEKISKKKVSLDGLVVGDVIGNSYLLFHTTLSQFTKDTPLPDMERCKTFIVSIPLLDINLNKRPFGHCSYCCPIIDPKQLVTFYFTNKITKENMTKLNLYNTAGSVRLDGVNSTLPTAIYIHGFSEHGFGHSARAVRDAYLSVDEDYNIIIVDWSRLAAAPWYLQAAQSTKIVGTILGEFIKFYSDTGELPLSKIHIIGFSLGSHVAGFAGKYLRGEVPRITGLDPALPLFPLHDLSQRITKTDAKYVDVIHSDAGVIGWPVSVGHADFYPNGGNLFQPGCTFSGLVEQKYFEDIFTCNHMRAPQFYAESVKNSLAFPATKCGISTKGVLKECQFKIEGYMGFPAKQTNSMGDYYLTTHELPPFSKTAIEQQKDMKKINLVL